MSAFSNQPTVSLHLCGVLHFALLLFSIASIARCLFLSISMCVCVSVFIIVLHPVIAFVFIFVGLC